MAGLVVKQPIVVRHGICFFQLRDGARVLLHADVVLPETNQEL